MMTTNVIESINEVLLKVRGEPVITLLNTMQVIVTHWFEERRCGIRETDMTTKRVTAKVEKLIWERRNNGGEMCWNSMS